MINLEAIVKNESITLILNPAAGSGRALKQLPLIEKVLAESGRPHKIVLTKKSGEAEVLAANADTDIVISAGGDGTLHEVVNGILSHQNPPILGVLPVGTGNDFAKLVNPASKDTKKLLANILNGDSRQVDCGEVIWTNKESAGGQRYFINAVGAGFDAKVATVVVKKKMVKGKMAYLIAVLQTLGKWKPVKVTIQTDGETFIQDQDLFLVTAGNGQCSGGSFYLTPKAQIDDGKLDVCFVQNSPIRRVLRIIPNSTQGKHLEDPEVFYRQTRQLEVSLGSPVSIHADGEILSETAVEFTINTKCNALSVIFPDKS